MQLDHKHFFHVLFYLAHIYADTFGITNLSEKMYVDDDIGRFCFRSNGVEYCITMERTLNNEDNCDAA